MAGPTYEEIRYEVADAIATVTFHRPERLNALTGTMSLELQDAMFRADADPEIRVIILTGSGRGFCAGADMDLLRSVQGKSGSSARPREGLDPSRIRGPREGVRADFANQYSYFPSIRKPSIGAINVPTAGLGFVLALYCDLRIASEAARLGTVFARRGLVAEHGISWMLPRLVGMANACDLLFSGRMVDAAEALRMGLVSRVVPADELMDSVVETATEMAALASPRSIAVMKEQIYNAQFQTLAEAIDVANEEMVKSFDSEDFREGVAHFLEKRTPAFSGR